MDLDRVDRELDRELDKIYGLLDIENDVKYELENRLLNRLLSVENTRISKKRVTSDESDTTSTSSTPSTTSSTAPSTEESDNNEILIPVSIQQEIARKKKPIHKKLSKSSASPKSKRPSKPSKPSKPPLSTEDVLSIREQWEECSTGRERVQLKNAIAKKYNLHPQYIYRVATRRARADIK